MTSSEAVSSLINKEIQFHKSPSSFDTFLLNQPKKKDLKGRNTVKGNAIRGRGGKEKGKRGLKALEQKLAIATEAMILMQSNHQVITIFSFFFLFGFVHTLL